MRNLIVINVLPYAAHACIPLSIRFWCLSVNHKDDTNLTEEITIDWNTPSKTIYPIPVEWQSLAS